jgi:hypothetical protein
MQKNYLVKSPIHFADFGFFVKVGDILVHDIGNANRLTVYRNGEIIKAVKQTQLGLAALVKSEFIQEVVQAPSAPKVVPKAPKTSSEPIAKIHCELATGHLDDFLPLVDGSNIFRRAPCV